MNINFFFKKESDQIEKEIEKGKYELLVNIFLNKILNTVHYTQKMLFFNYIFIEKKRRSIYVVFTEML